mmetsp:Transcript_13271/g.24890  ORF Transcript_13271/g.24890 Transcript_13271/m.24890 type:complete len:146 (+) Transcript_13271:2496-2933(+)
MDLNPVLGQALEAFRLHLRHFMVYCFQAAYGPDWAERALQTPTGDTIMTAQKSPEAWDIVTLCNLLYDHWNGVFQSHISHRFPRAVITIVKFYRNSWAHQRHLSLREAYRVVDLMDWMLTEIQMPNQDMSRFRVELLRALYESSY